MYKDVQLILDTYMSSQKDKQLLPTVVLKRKFVYFVSKLLRPFFPSCHSFEKTLALKPSKATTKSWHLITMVILFP